MRHEQVVELMLSDVKIGPVIADTAMIGIHEQLDVLWMHVINRNLARFDSVSQVQQTIVMHDSAAHLPLGCGLNCQAELA